MIEAKLPAIEESITTVLRPCHKKEEQKKPVTRC